MAYKHLSTLYAYIAEEKRMLPEPPPTLKGKEAEAFLKDAAKPPTLEQKKFVEEALKRFPE